ncbi:hypothetical protein LCGC14_3159010 [marine sediment metagenome]|uniref:Uncharacterized protein n=1 Tax=marine sediment metagenome TaxID=412755 RepID=A0A0F8VRX3_9ZZZZ
MTTKHTATPWSKEVWKPGTTQFQYFVRYADGRVAEVYASEDLDRIVSCVNACEGLTEEQIKEAIKLWKIGQGGDIWKDS